MCVPFIDANTAAAVKMSLQAEVTFCDRDLADSDLTSEVKARCQIRSERVPRVAAIKIKRTLYGVNVGCEKHGRL